MAGFTFPEGGPPRDKGMVMEGGRGNRRNLTFSVKNGFWSPFMAFPKPAPVLSWNACLLNNEVA